MNCDPFVRNYYTVWKPLGIGPADPKLAENVGHYKGLSKEYRFTIKEIDTFNFM